MTDQSAELPRRILRFPTPRKGSGPVVRRARMLFGATVTPFVLGAAWLAGTPGMRFRSRCIALAGRALSAGDRRQSFMLAANPMDSFRYFELDFVDRNVRDRAVGSYLDVSSPRLAPLSVVDARPALVADLVNPIESDLADTMALARTLRLDAQLRPRCALIEEAGYAPASFDLITCISVLEHIPDDRQAVTAMWRLLRPGGRLILTVPCARHATDEYTDLDEYELFSRDDAGLVFWQRYYDEKLLQDRIWSITGAPGVVRVYGERRAGAYDRNVLQKRTNPDYPYWWEPLLMRRQFRYFDSIAGLSGMGVIAMVFDKPEVA